MITGYEANIKHRLYFNMPPTNYWGFISNMQLKQYSVLKVMITYVYISQIVTLEAISHCWRKLKKINWERYHTWKNELSHSAFDMQGSTTTLGNSLILKEIAVHSSYIANIYLSLDFPPRKDMLLGCKEHISLFLVLISVIACLSIWSETMLFSMWPETDD